MSKLIGNQDFNTASHSVYRLTYHVVWCVKLRRHILSAEWRDFLFASLRESAEFVNCRSEWGGEPYPFSARHSAHGCAFRAYRQTEEQDRRCASGQVWAVLLRKARTHGVEQWFLCCFHRRGDIGGFEALCRKSGPRLTHSEGRDCGARIGSFCFMARLSQVTAAEAQLFSFLFGTFIASLIIGLVEKYAHQFW